MGGFWAVWGYKWKVQGKGVKYDPGSADPMVPPPHPLPVVWCGGGLLPPSLWCGGVRAWVCLGWFPPSPPSPPVAWCGFGFSCGGSPCFLSLLWVFGILTPMMIMMKIRTMITIIIILIISSNILMFLWLVVGCLLPT